MKRVLTPARPELSIPASPAKAPPVSVSCRDLSLRFPVYGVDAKSLKKSLAAVTVGGRLGRHAGVTEVKAISHLNLELKAGDRLGLIGHNGSGKTTLLRALSGAYEPDEGEVNYPAIFEAIDRAGYAGWIGCEYRPRGRTEDGLGWLRPYGVVPRA